MGVSHGVQSFVHGSWKGMSSMKGLFVSKGIVCSLIYLLDISIYGEREREHGSRMIDCLCNELYSLVHLIEILVSKTAYE